MQTLISTARQALKQEGIDRKWLFTPSNPIQAGKDFIANERSKTEFDPSKVACAYDAGGIYHNKDANSRWKMQQYPIGASQDANRFVSGSVTLSARQGPVG